LKSTKFEITLSVPVSLQGKLVNLIKNFNAANATDNGGVVEIKKALIKKGVSHVLQDHNMVDKSSSEKKEGDVD